MLMIPRQLTQNTGNISRLVLCTHTAGIPRLTRDYIVAHSPALPRSGHHNLSLRQTQSY